MKMMHTNNRRNPASGFTLVELMVVVAIIGILAAVAGPRVQAFRAKGVQAEAKSNLHSFYLAMISFEDANDRFPNGQGACVDNQPCAIGADQITFRQTADSKYRYGSSSEPEGFLAGARSRRPLLNGIFDAWAVNTNKVLCSQRDATSPLDEAAQNAGAGLTSSCGRARQATVDIGDNGQPTTAPAVGANGVDAKQ